MVIEQILSDTADGTGGHSKSGTTPLEGNGQYLSVEKYVLSHRISRNANN